jgi:hypothetical protein
MTTGAVKPPLRREGQLWIYEQGGLQAEFKHLRQERGGMYGGLNGEVRIVTTLPGVNPHLHEARLNLSATSARDTIAKVLIKRAPGFEREQIEDFVESACVLVMRAFNKGEPFVNLSTHTYTPPQFAVANLFPKNKRNQVYAPAEHFKTTLMLAFLMDIATGQDTLGFSTQQCPVSYLDWETDSDDATNLWHRLAWGRGLDVIPDLHYRRCHNPIWVEAESASVEFSREGVGTVLLDSAFWACGGNPNDQEKVGLMFEGIDALGSVTSVLLNHTGASEGEKTRRRHYGLEHFRNAVRASWELRKAETPGQSSVVNLGLYRDKLNMRRSGEGPYGFVISFDGDDGPISIVRKDEAITDAPELDESRPAGDRILDVLAEGKANRKYLMERLNLPEGTVKNAIFRLKGKVKGGQDDTGFYYELTSTVAATQ